MRLPDKDKLIFVGIAVFIIIVFFYFILGFTGVISALGIILLFILPIYLILDNFNLDYDEKLVFSFFIGAGVFPSITYYLALFISFKLAVIVTFLLIITVGLIIKKIKKKYLTKKPIFN